MNKASIAAGLGMALLGVSTASALALNQGAAGIFTVVSGVNYNAAGIRNTSGGARVVVGTPARNPLGNGGAAQTVAWNGQKNFAFVQSCCSVDSRRPNGTVIATKSACAGVNVDGDYQRSVQFGANEVAGNSSFVMTCTLNPGDLLRWVRVAP